MNLLQCVMTLMSLWSLENLWVKSSGVCRQATCTFLSSISSVEMLNSAVGQLDGSSRSHCGPFHHSVDVASVAGSIPLEIRSAGLAWDGTCLHVAEDVSFCIMVIRLPTNVLHLFDGPCIHVKTIDESVHRYVEGRYSLLEQLGQQCGCTKFQSWYC
jgi:hypothetical protein